jgi:hypothetical protein
MAHAIGTTAAQTSSTPGVVRSISPSTEYRLGDQQHEKDEAEHASDREGNHAPSFSSATRPVM